MAKKPVARTCKTGNGGGTWKFIGNVGVDSGQLAIVDPVYAGDLVDYDRDIENRHEALKFPKGNEGLAVVFDSGLGDGMYKVYAKIEDVPGWGKRIVEVKIKLME